MWLQTSTFGGCRWWTTEQLVTVPMCKLIGPASFLLLCNCIHTVHVCRITHKTINDGAQMCAGWEGFSTTTSVCHKKGQKVKCNLGQLKTTVIAT